MRESLLDQLRRMLKQGGELFESATLKIVVDRAELVDAIAALEAAEAKTC